ncbi:MAG TPA: hypothetical protein VL863_07670 [bacterium]|nr:hypothetical protein [bacterium]
MKKPLLRSPVNIFLQGSAPDGALIPFGFGSTNMPRRRRLLAVNTNGVLIIQPRVGPSRAGEELPWVHVQTKLSNPDRVESVHRKPGVADFIGNTGLNDRIPSGLFATKSVFIREIRVSSAARTDWTE